MEIYEIIRIAPPYLRKKYSAIRSYVKESLEPSEKRKENLKHTKRELLREKRSIIKSLIDEATLLLFIFDIYRFFMRGTEEAKDTVDTFRKLDVMGFSIGNQRFEDRNENVMRGEVLARNILSIVDKETEATIKKAINFREILEPYKERAQNIWRIN
ncbi:MAG: hypothetical protein WCX97_04905 [Candidatus Magasanikbacteria bacterium]